MARSTLELLLESMKERDEEPPDQLPALPQRPTSRARLPSRKRTSTLPFANLNQADHHSNGHMHYQALLASKGTSDSFLNQRNGESLVRHSPLQEVVMSMEEPKLPAHVEEVSGFSSNGWTKESQNGDQPLQRAESVKALASTQKGSLDNGSSEDQILHLSQQESAYTNTKRRRRPIQCFQKGSRVWFMTKDNEWMLGVVQSAGDINSIVRVADGQLSTIALEKLFPANPELLDGVDDLVQLSYIHEPAILYNLQYRYDLSKLCTRAGPMLIAVTPPKESSPSKVCLSSSHSSLEALKKVNKDAGHSHVYVIADTALQALKRDWMNQSIIISGKTGAGKSESVNTVLEYLVIYGGNSELGNLILSANPILEAFGNARTCNNANASRFGKIMDLNYDRNGNLWDACYQIVFFEKSRVVSRAEGEYSFHIFYQLCEGADLCLREKLNLKGAKEFEYLNKVGSIEADHSSKFQSLLNALHVLGITEKVQHVIFSLLAAVLWLGNITQAALDNENQAALDNENQAVDNAAKLLGCSKENLLEALGVGWCILDDVFTNRDKLACAIYERVFYWLVSRINEFLKSDKSHESRSISVVDIPGFGFSKSNGLEGLLVNYMHEHLQQFTQSHIFQQKEEVAIYSGYGTLVADSSKNGDSIDFLEYGLFPFVIEEFDALSKVESKFMQRMEGLLTRSTRCKLKQTGEFSISHGFGEVTYDATRFSKEMRDCLSPPIYQLLYTCATALQENFFPKDNYFHEENFFLKHPSHYSSFSSGQERVLQCMQLLDNTAPHFIFCIIPNESLLTQSFEQSFVSRQLQVFRMMEAIRIWRSGYPIQISHQLFASRFGVLLGPSSTFNQEPLDVCVAVLQRFEIPPHVYQVGLTKLFFRPKQIDKLEHMREKSLERIIGIQKTFRGYRLRHQLEKEKIAITHLQALVRGWLARRGSTRQVSEQLETGNNSIHQDVLEGKPKSGLKEEYHLEQQEDSSMSNVQLMKAQKEDQLTTKECSSVEVADLNGHLAAEAVERTNLEKMRRQMIDAEIALQNKEEEVALLQERLKEHERSRLAYEVNMKSMEEMWKKQIASLQQSLSEATKGVESEPENKHGDSDDHSGVQSTPPHGASTRNTPETMLGEPDLTVAKCELNPRKSVLDNLTKELEHRTQVFNDDAKFLVEVKSGQIAANFKPDDELQKLRKRFEMWKKDYKSRLKETKGILKKLGKPESEVTSKKKWWGRK